MVATQTGQYVRLNQLIAVRKGVVSSTAAKAIELHRDVQKTPLLTGIARTYRKINDMDPDLPTESTRVQIRADQALRGLRDVMTRLFDVTAAVDWTNCAARADVVVDGQVLIGQAPTTYLLFLEKQLGEIRQFIAGLPTLDPSEKWQWDDNADAWATSPAETTRTRKVMRNHEVSPATDKHPAQVTVFQEDEIVGYWATTKFSGAMPAARKAELLARVGDLVDAVKMAREEGNMTAVVDPKPAGAVFAWLLRH